MPFDGPHMVDTIVDDLYSQRAQVNVRRAGHTYNATPYCFPDGSKGAQFILGIYSNGETGYLEQHYRHQGTGFSGHDAVRGQQPPQGSDLAQGSSRLDLEAESVFPLAYRSFDQPTIYHIGGLIMQVPGEHVAQYTLHFPIGE